jgi:DNA-binding transcriptional MerR regulator
MAEIGRRCSAGNGQESECLYTVGEVCRLTGTTRKTLFYYDRIGLLTPSRREGVQNFKEYDSGKIQRLKKIIQYREAGLRISEIREILDDKDADTIQILLDALQRLQKEQSDTEEKIWRLRQLIKAETERTRQKRSEDSVCSLSCIDGSAGNGLKTFIQWNNMDRRN